jgi:ribosomal protein S12 methylthiotransferase accessory factor YcaO
MPSSLSLSSSLSRSRSLITNNSSNNNDDNSKNNIVKFSEVRSYVNKDILDDIKLILNRLKKAGLTTAIIINLTNSDIGVPVVRAIVPGLEIYTVTPSVMGRRAKQFFKKRTII